MASVSREAHRVVRLVHAGRLLTLVLTAALAALLAHIAIDVAGDTLLAHDTYDDVAHGSRSLCGVLVIGAAAATAWRLLLSTLNAARGARTAVRGIVAPPSLGVWIGSVGALTVVLLAAMEALDLLIAGTHPDDVADLLGGSLPLGGSIATICAVGVALVGRGIGHWFDRAGAAAVARAVRACLVERERPQPADWTGRSRRVPLVIAIPLRSHNASRRGPPAFR